MMRIIDWRVTHGATLIPEYRAWASMMQRCRNTRCERYPRYGGRGIAVCERWNSAAAFLADMGPRPSQDHSLDRIDNEGNYEPANCRWATRSMQQQNKTSYRADHRLPRGDHHWTRRNTQRARDVARKNISRAHRSGADNGNAKLTPETAEAIRVAYASNPNAKMADLGQQFGVGRETARKVVKGVSW